MKPNKPSALEAIVSDLKQDQRVRRAHFVPALMLVAIVAVGVLVSMKVRPDLLELPPAQLAMQGCLWVLCLVIMPAIGVGLLFPGRSTRVLLAGGAILLACAAATGWPFAATHHGGHGGMDRCLMLVVGTGGMLVLIGFLSGAFVQRRGVSGVFWVASGLTLVALNVVTWHCPSSGLMHILPSHVGGAALLLGIAVVVGILSRRRNR
ncbi:MAG: hypothetical protein K0V04_23030 [Deltaproteobacteria bacterium]|nr:hypothetical protein [Deltaproteobacteria bacterium]